MYRHALSIGMIAIALVLVWQLFDTLLAIGVGARAAGGVTLLVAVSPPLSIYSVRVLHRGHERDDRGRWSFASSCSATHAHAARWAIAGALAGLLVFVHIRNAGLLLALLGVAWLQARRRGDVRLGAAFAIGAAVTIALRTINTHYLWGSWLATPHARAGDAYGIVDTLLDRQPSRRRTADRSGVRTCCPTRRSFWRPSWAS